MCGLKFEVRGRGAYTSGMIKFEETTKIYVYVGEFPDKYYQNTFNGNKNVKMSSPPGGGATDFRLEKGEFWYN